ncbi:MAG: hypothetical protein K6C69_04110 [Lachnospiraceae bacterium]|nr:hypothetical protein [Lachnospiraceae bacterium]
MAGKIGYKDEEYEKLSNKLREVHQNNLDNIEELYKSISELNQVDGGFYVNQISENIIVVIDRLKELSQLLNDFYDGSEKVISSFSNSMKNNDTFKRS